VGGEWLHSQQGGKHEMIFEQKALDYKNTQTIKTSTASDVPMLGYRLEYIGPYSIFRSDQLSPYKNADEIPSFDIQK
jgi:hypothetical protein